MASDIGFEILAQGKRLWRLRLRTINHLAVDQPVQQIQDMGFGRHAFGQSKFYGFENRLFIVLKNQCEEAHVTCRSLPRPTRSTAVRARPLFSNQWRTRSRCHRHRVRVRHQRTGTRASGLSNSISCVCNRIGKQQKGPAVRQLDMGRLQLRALAAQNRKVFAPVKLEGFVRITMQRHNGPAPCRLLFTLPICPPQSRKSRHPDIGPGKAKRHEIGVQPLASSSLPKAMSRLSYPPKFWH